MPERGGTRLEAVRRLNAALVKTIVGLRRGEGDARGRIADAIAQRILRLGGEPDYASVRSALRGRAPR